MRWRELHYCLESCILFVKCRPLFVMLILIFTSTVTIPLALPHMASNCNTLGYMKPPAAATARRIITSSLSFVSGTLFAFVHLRGQKICLPLHNSCTHYIYTYSNSNLHPYSYSNGHSKV